MADSDGGATRRDPRPLGARLVKPLAYSLALASALGGSVPSRANPADGCPTATTARLAGRFDDAATAARSCLEAAPDDVAVWFELSRALGYGQHFAEALEWVERGLERYPDDADLGLWRVRLLAWSGHVDRAREAFAEVSSTTPGVLDDRETAMLASDLEFWSQAWAPARDGFSGYLARWPDDADALRKRGIASLESGLEAQALTDFRASCRLAGASASACAMRDELERKQARFGVRLEPSLASDGRRDEFATTLTVTARVWDELVLGLAGELRLRSAADASSEAIRDTLGHVLVRYRAARWSIEGDVGIAFDPVIAPELTAWVEPAVALARPLWLHLRYWRLAFAGGVGADVVSPSLDLTLGPVTLDLRYWLGLPFYADGERARGSHSLLLRARSELGPNFAGELGLGFGTAGDYLTTSAPDPAGLGASQGHELALVGLRWSPSWRNSFRLGYVIRRESVSDSTLWRHELALGWELRL